MYVFIKKKIQITYSIQKKLLTVYHLLEAIDYIECCVWVEFVWVKKRFWNTFLNQTKKV